MILKLIRHTFTDKSTIGSLYIDGVFECYTLEDPIRDEKVYGKTAIPYGIYDVVIDWSNRFQAKMPHILNVPNFLGIRIHPGNYPEDTEGCVLVGKTKDVDFIGKSKVAYKDLMAKLTTTKETIKIEIEKGGDTLWLEHTLLK